MAKTSRKRSKRNPGEKHQPDRIPNLAHPPQIDPPSPDRVHTCVAMAELACRDPLYFELCNPTSESPPDYIFRNQLEGKYPFIEVTSQNSFRLREAWALPLRYMENSFSLSAAAMARQTFPNPHTHSESPSLFLQVVLSGISHWDIERLAKQFKAILRVSLKNHHDQYSNFGTFPSSRVSKELKFIHTVTAANFARDLRRYDLHIFHGLTFRLIALFEEQLEKGQKESSDIPYQQKVGKQVRSESGVGDSIHRIYLAIHREKYKAKRRRIDTPARGIEPYKCPTHGSECSPKCAYLKKWIKRVSPTLPSDKTGQSVPTISLF